MQQAIYNNSSIQTTKTNAAAKTSTPKPSGLLRWVARRWDMVGVLTLMGSSAACGIFALAHVGL